MNHTDFHVFGLATDHLHYIGWTGRPLSDARSILSDLHEHGSREMARWVREAGAAGKIELFEIETANTAQDASDAAHFWCEYFGMLGARVLTDPA